MNKYLVIPTCGSGQLRVAFKVCGKRAVSQTLAANYELAPPNCKNKHNRKLKETLY